EKGINKFLVTMDANFAQMQNQVKLLPNNIDSIIEIVQEVLIFFEKNNLNYNSDFKIQLNKTLRKKKSSLILKDQNNDTSS
ncbi:phage tail protein, partial [Francisella tularensis subsp. holarctica]|nr:phage tail protein [Francisella tularensis subsp. holarctica]